MEDKGYIFWIRGGESAKRILMANPYLRILLVDGDCSNPLRDYVEMFYCYGTGKEEDVNYIIDVLLPTVKTSYNISFSFTRSAYYVPNLIVQKANKLIGKMTFFSSDIKVLFDKKKWWSKLKKKVRCAERYDAASTDALCFPCVLKKSIGEESKNVWFIRDKRELLSFTKEIPHDAAFIEPYYGKNVFGISWLYINGEVLPLALYKKEFNIVGNRFLFKGYSFRKKYKNLLDELKDKLQIITSSLSLKTGIFSAEFILNGKEFILIDLGLQCDKDIDTILSKIYNPYSIIFEVLCHNADIESKALSLVFSSYLKMEGFYEV